MDIPPPLLALLQQKGNANPDLERYEFIKYRDTWQLYLDLLELDQEKLARLIDRHGKPESGGEADAKFEARKKLGAAFNLVPMLVSMVKGYIFSDEPRIDTKGDTDLDAFMADCDGAGTSYIDWCRQTGLPLAMTLGHIDVLVQNPLVVGDLSTEQDASEKKVCPKLFTITPLKRINWSTQSNGEYNWLTFKDKGSENFNPFARDVKSPEAYITISAALPAGAVAGVDKAFWLRQWQAVVTEENAKEQMQIPDGAYVAPTTETNGSLNGRWITQANFIDMDRVPVSTLYWQKSTDPERRHFGVSKIAMIASLTRLAIQVLSWTTEDILANLAILGLPTKGGRPPGPPSPAGQSQVNGGANGDASDASMGNLNAFSTLYYDHLSRHAPGVIQGDVKHIQAKMDFIAALITEVLRLAHMQFGAHAKAERVNSGVQAVVQRNELFMELKDAAGALDRFTLDLFANVKSWATGKQVNRDDIEKAGVTIDFFKGPYTTESLSEVIDNADAVIEMFRSVSPTMAEAAMKDVARAYLYSTDPILKEVVDEIEKNAPTLLASATIDAVLAEVAAIGAGKATEQVQSPIGTAANPDTTGKDNAPGATQKVAPSASK